MVSGAVASVVAETVSELVSRGYMERAVDNAIRQAEKEGRVSANPEGQLDTSGIRLANHDPPSPSTATQPKSMHNWQHICQLVHVLRYAREEWRRRSQDRDVVWAGHR